MNRENIIYQSQLNNAIETNDFKMLYGKKIMITGATGLIGSCVIDILMKENEINQADIEIFAMVRNVKNAEKIFKKYIKCVKFKIIEYDVTQEIKEKLNVDYVIHAASNAHPLAFAKEPINTLLGNVEGLKNILNYSIRNKISKVLYVSSGEVYGESNGNENEYSEEYRGYINNLSARSCYPIGKLAAETLGICYAQEKNIDVVIVRPCHIYGPTMTEKDSRAIAQFIRNAISSNDIVMKSKGEQYRSYCYVIDCATAILTVLIKGENCNAYNICNSQSNITIKDMAILVANSVNRKVIFEIPDDVEKSGYNVVKKSILSDKKIKDLGWNPKYDMKNGIESTIKILKNER